MIPSVSSSAKCSAASQAVRSVNTCITEIAEPLGADVHDGLHPSERLRCADLVDHPHISIRMRRSSPRLPTSLNRHPKAALSVSGLTNSAPTTCSCGVRSNGQVSALGLATFYSRLPGRAARPRAHGAGRVSQGGFDTDPGARPEVADRLRSGLHAQPARRQWTQPTDFRAWPRRSSFGFVDLEHQIGCAYVMNRFSHQGQRGSAQRRPVQQGLRRARAKTFLDGLRRWNRPVPAIRGPRAVPCGSLPTHPTRLAGSAVHRYGAVGQI